MEQLWVNIIILPMTEESQIGLFYVLIIGEVCMKFNQKDIDAFDKFFTEVSNNSFKNINKRDEGGETILHHAVRVSDQKTVKLLIKKRSRHQCDK